MARGYVIGYAIPGGYNPGCTSLSNYPPETASHLLSHGPSVYALDDSPHLRRLQLG